MKKIAIALCAVGGVAVAQPAVEKKKMPEPAPAATKPAPAPEAKPAKPPEMPKPPQEIADAIKARAGTWKCTGTAEMGGQTGDVKATVTFKTDLNGWWMQSSFTGTMAKMPAFKFTSFTTYDAAMSKFYRVSMNASGGHSTVWGTVSDKKITWEGDARWRGADVKVRDTEEMVGPKEVKVLGEASKDGGKTWTKDHEATCKK
jgi:hypothetical protein